MGWLLMLLARVVVLAAGVALLRVVNPLLLGLLSGVLVDMLLCLLCWRGLIVRQYRRFLEEDL
jgi:membrane protein required for beta-lactamase induction